MRRLRRQNDGVGFADKKGFAFLPVERLEHNRQGLRVVDFLEERYPNFKGLNLTYDPERRQITNNIWLETDSGEWINSPIKEDVKQNEKKK